MNLDKETKKNLIHIARTTINAAVKRTKELNYEKEVAAFPALKEKAGAFVTVEKRGHLRGCIGYIEAREPLYKTVIMAARSAALNDDRFGPLQPDELNEIELEISVLSTFSRVENINDIMVGTHGLMIESGFYHGLLLPQVATEYQWDRITFIEQTCHKAGLNKHAWKEKATVIKSFTAIVFNERDI